MATGAQPAETLENYLRVRAVDSTVVGTLAVGLKGYSVEQAKRLPIDDLVYQVGIRAAGTVYFALHGVGPPAPKWGGYVGMGGMQGINLDVMINRKFPLSCIVDSGCMVTMLLSSQTFDDLVGKLEIEPSNIHEMIGGDIITRRVSVTVFLSTKLHNGAEIKPSATMDVYRSPRENAVPLLGLPALELLHLGIGPDKSVFVWDSPFMGYRVLKSERVTHEPSSPIAPGAWGAPTVAPVAGAGRQRSPTRQSPLGGSSVTWTHQARTATHEDRSPRSQTMSGSGSWVSGSWR
jgi:hypothetical protein